MIAWLWFRVPPSRWPLLAISKVRGWWWARRRRRQLLTEAIDLYGEAEMQRNPGLWESLSIGEQEAILHLRQLQKQITNRGTDPGYGHEIDGGPEWWMPGSPL